MTTNDACLALIDGLVSMQQNSPIRKIRFCVFSLVPSHIREPPEEDEDTDSAAHAIHIFSKLLCQRHMEKQLEKESVVVTVKAGFIAHLYGRLDF